MSCHLNKNLTYINIYILMKKLRNLQVINTISQKRQQKFKFYRKLVPKCVRVFIKCSVWKKKHVASGDVDEEQNRWDTRPAAAGWCAHHPALFLTCHLQQATCSHMLLSSRLYKASRPQYLYIFQLNISMSNYRIIKLIC